ncbi:MULTISPECIES: TonB-dependent receptor [Kordiimonas]|uniref:TonB-dependent receptor n=1 Tax=Kordiimonas TaxID=288021 RepID=UPI00257DDDF9|nr:TonB-dependent receptor [Kordiimonas sp. UBA4487]
MPPLVEGKLLTKAVVAYNGRDGYAINSVTGEDDGDKEALSARFAVRAHLSDRFMFDLNADISDDDSDTSRTPNRETSVFGVVPASDEPFEVDADFNDLNRLKTKGISGVATYDVSDAMTLKSVTAYRTMNYDTHLDLDATALAFLGVFVDEDQKQFSQEFQLSYEAESGLSFVGGLYHLREHDITMSGIFGPAIAFITNSVNDQINRSYAAYGQADIPVTDKLTLTAGLRFTYEEKEFTRVQEFFGADTPLVPEIGQGLRVTDVVVEENWNNLSPKVGMNYQLDDDHMLYASASKGFKSGGFDGRSNSDTEAVPYDPETLWAFEVGSKNTLAGGKATLNIAAFYNDYKNLQLSSFTADEGGAFQALFTNAGAATIKGVELELAARPIPALNLQASVSYTDAQYDEYIGEGGVDISHERHLVNAPEWTLFAAVDYDIDLANGASILLHGDAAYRSKTYPTVSSSEILVEDGYGLLNARVAYEAASGSWSLYAGVKNITDTRYRTHGFDLSASLGFQMGYYGAPRTWAAGLEFRF